MARNGGAARHHRDVRPVAEQVARWGGHRRPTVAVTRDVHRSSSVGHRPASLVTVGRVDAHPPTEVAAPLRSPAWSQIKVGVVGAGGTDGRPRCARRWPSTRHWIWSPRSTRTPPVETATASTIAARSAGARRRRRARSSSTSPSPLPPASTLPWLADARHARGRRHHRLHRRRRRRVPRGVHAAATASIASNFADQRGADDALRRAGRAVLRHRRDHRAAPRRARSTPRRAPR